MDQSVTIKIANKEYRLRASSEQMEQMMRMAAESINQKLDAYTQKFPTQELQDKLAFVTLNETISRLDLQRKLQALEKSEKEFSAEMEGYLSEMEKTQSR